MNITEDLTSSVTVATTTGTTGAHGDPAYGPQTVVAARVEPSTKRIMNSAGQEVLSAYFIMCAAKLTVFDRVWLPGTNTADNNQARTPARVDFATDIDGSVTWWEA